MMSQSCWLIIYNKLFTRILASILLLHKSWVYPPSEIIQVKSTNHKPQRFLNNSMNNTQNPNIIIIILIYNYDSVHIFKRLITYGLGKFVGSL